MILREISCCPELLNAIGPETEADHDACRRAGAVGQFLHPPACRQSRGPLAAMLRFFRMKTRDMQLMGVAGFQSMLDHEPLMPCRRMEAAAAPKIAWPASKLPCILHVLRRLLVVPFGSRGIVPAPTGPGFFMPLLEFLPRNGMFRIV
ncbi:hypothetical protein [Glutamicibacter halophytocola]|uniref:hypothetical protein n=1 Tax=Glutamicibacter halophytocola TaxID=1933880 RepID=UPI0015C53B39|nr:hypothetical protein [Glutamicibacter halophytocola]NQD41491.1 hypothetical protein [Glutamicibacter halophytocola]